MHVAPIANPAGVWGGTVTGGQQLVVDCVAGAALAAGDLVVVGTDGVTVQGTATANNKLAYGVVAPQSLGTLAADATAYASGAVCPVIIYGIAKINIGANTVAAGDILATSTGSKVAVTNNAATVGQAIAIALTASASKDANNAILALIGRM